MRVEIEPCIPNQINRIRIRHFNQSLSICVEGENHVTGIDIGSERGQGYT